jgi:hypothetical protein
MGLFFHAPHKTDFFSQNTSYYLHKIQSLATIIERDSFNKGLYLTLAPGFELELTFPDQSPQKIPLESKLSVGGSDKSELCIEDYGLSPLHLSFRIHNGVLSLHNLGGKNETLLGDQVLNHGKMYLLNIEDKIKVGDIEIKICEGVPVEQVISEPPLEESKPQDLEEKTEPGFKFDSMTDDQIEETENDDEEEYEEFTNDEYEDEDEDEEESGPGFFQRIKEKFKKKEVQKDPRKLDFKKSAAKVTKVTPPGPFIRLFALLANIAFCITLANDILPHFGLDTIFTSLYEKVLPALSKNPEALKAFEMAFNIVICFFAVELISVLLFGVNLCQFIFGFKSKKGFIVSRIQAVFRTIIGYFTSSSLIFDIPCIIGKRTFKEFITGSQLYSRSKVYTVLASLILFPLILLSPIYAPIALNLSAFGEIKTDTIKNIKIKKNNKIQRSWPSHSLNLKFLGKWDKNFNILPSSKNKLTIYHIENLKPVTISKEKSYSLKDQLRTISEKNPIFKIQYPSLQKFLTSKKEGKLSTQAIKEYSRLVGHALSLDFQTLPALLTGHGPFLKDLFILKSELKKLLKAKNNSFIQHHITNKKIVYQSTNILKKNKVTTILVLDEQGMLKIYKSQANRKDSKYLSKLNNTFFKSISPIKPNETANSWDWVKVSNLIHSIKSKKKDITDLQIASVYNFFFELSSNQIELAKKDEKKKENLKWISEQVEKTALDLEKLSNSGKLANLNELSTSLKKLSKAVSANDVAFFSLE